MKIYLDTGNIDEIKKISEIGLIDGVTTNPSLIAKEGGDFTSTIKEIVKILNKNCINKNFTVSAEVTNISSAESIIKEARKLSEISKNVIVKIPITFEGLKAVGVLSEEDIRCNMTLCFSSNQALLAAKAGAWCVSPFIGRVDDEGYDGIELIADIRRVYDNYGFKTKILAASIRGVRDVSDCSKIGADIVTIPAKIFSKLYYNPLTDIGIESFNKDWNEYLKKQKKSKK